MDKSVKLVAQKIGITPQDVKAILAERQREANIAAGSSLALFKGEYGKRTAVVWTQWIVYDIAGYGIGLYAPIITESFGFSGAPSLLLSFIWYMPFGFLGALGAVLLND
ncbi:MAG: MFS transporter, partial [Candidatus Acidifodinimicrobium sp.]